MNVKLNVTSLSIDLNKIGYSSFASKIEDSNEFTLIYESKGAATYFTPPLIDNAKKIYVDDIEIEVADANKINLSAKQSKKVTCVFPTDLQITSISNKFASSVLVEAFFDKFKMSGITFFSSAFEYADLRNVSFPKNEKIFPSIMKKMFYYCEDLRDLDLSMFDLSKMPSSSASTRLSSIFEGCWSLENLTAFFNWRRHNLAIENSSKLSPASVHDIISKAYNGGTARTLILHATAYDNWVNSEYYLEDQAVLSDKGITVAKA